MPSSTLTDLLEHLKSVFQFENNDLDFGIYKVLRLKRAEVSAFLDDELGEIVEAELKKAATGASDAKYQRLATYVREETGPKYHALVVSPQSVADNQDALRGLVEGAEGEAELVDAIDGGVGIDPELEDRVYNHLLGFFQRYYRDGDFGYNDRSLATYKQLCCRTLKAETARPPKRDMAAQQRRFDDWRAEFNADRPHDALGDAVPADRYAPSPRPMPDVLPEPGYPGHLGGAYAPPGPVRLARRGHPAQEAAGLRQPGARRGARRAGGGRRRGVERVLLRPPAGEARRADVEAVGLARARQECKRSARSNL